MMDWTPDQQEALFYALAFFVALMGLLGGLGWLAEKLERWTGKRERRRGRFI